VKLAVSREGDKEHIVDSGNLFYASLDHLAKQLRSNPSTRTILDLGRAPYCMRRRWLFSNQSGGNDSAAVAN